ncbi:MAG: hypothetical protein NT165_00910 [Candidatus Falkowbacteria bacterium]|nr:hypothetical protein [Candidatus Falkowbacteria bacterium]
MSNFENGHDNAQENMNLGWDASRHNQVVERLLKGENVQSILESLPGFSESFDHPLDTIDCSDGRVLDGRKIGIAGSGMLLSEKERDLFIQNYRGKIKKLTTHRDCGAAGIAFRSLGEGEIPEGISSADEYGTYQGKKLAEALGAEHEFIEKLANDYHNEVAIVLDSTGTFDSTSIADFPAHFVCSGAGLGFSEEYMKTELKTLAGIALGSHGFGQRFTEENPLYIIVTANSNVEGLFWKTIAEVALADFSGKVAIKSFVRPQIS